MYKLSKGCAGIIQDVAGLVSSQFPDSAEGDRLVRYMNAAHIAGYVGLGGPYSKRHFFDHFNRKYNLLNKEELAKVEVYNMDSGSATFKELVTWCQRDVVAVRKAGYIETYEAIDLQNRVLNFRAAMDGIYDMCEQPTQFFYIHFLSWSLQSIFHYLLLEWAILQDGVTRRIGNSRLSMVQLLCCKQFL